MIGSLKRKKLLASLYLNKGHYGINHKREEKYLEVFDEGLRLYYESFKEIF
jgi:hypothetical protein